MASEVSSGTTTNQGGVEETRLKLPPGFRFQPSDPELILDYLKPEMLSWSLSCPAIFDVDLNKNEPWDLPCKAKMVEEEWYFFCHKDRKYPRGMRTNRASDSTAYSAHQDFRRSRFIIPAFPPIRHILLDFWKNQRDSAHDDGALNMATPREEDSVHCSVRAPKPLVSVCADVVDELASTCEYLRSLWDRAIYHRDLKPSNVLLDEKTENHPSDFGLPSWLLHANDYTQIPMGSAVPTQNGPLDAKFLGKPSAKHGIEIKTGSHMTHRRTYLSVHHHPFIKMWPSARKWSGDILTSCARLITSKRTFGTAEAGWAHSTPHSGPVSEYIRKHFHIKDWLTVNESQQHSDLDSRRAEHAKMAVNTRTSASWIIATGAPHHATGDRNLLSGFTMEHDDLFVHAVNRVPMKVLARGAVVTDALILPDVWFVPGLTENLVSVSQLAELDHSIGFGHGECCIRSARDAKIVGKGRLQKGGHYVLDYLKTPLAI